jgi:hypothetical protein
MFDDTRVRREDMRAKHRVTLIRHNEHDEQDYDDYEERNEQ